MKKPAIVIIIFVFLHGHSTAQNLPDFEIINLKQNSDYKAAGSIALEASTYLLSTPFEKGQYWQIKVYRS